jgi:FkbM family methyltransferase
MTSAAVDPLLAGKRIDLVDFDDVKLLMFKDDNLYQLSVSEERKHRSLREHHVSVAAGGHPKSPVTPQNVGDARGARACFSIVLDHLWRQGLEFSVLDIGAFIGDFSIKTANIVRTFGKSNKAYAFDPTEAGALIPYNIELNGLEALVEHERLAILDYDGYALFSVSPGYYDASFAVGESYVKGKHQFNWLSLLGHLARTPRKAAYIKKFLRYLRRPEPASLIVPGTSIGRWLDRKKIGGHLLAKVDVEGADRVIVEELVSLKGRHAVVCFEFTANSFPSARDAAEFLGGLAKTHHLFDLWYSPNPCRVERLDPARLPNFVDDVQNARIFGYTDLLAIPKDLPGAEALAARLGALERTAEEYVL